MTKPNYFFYLVAFLLASFVYHVLSKHFETASNIVNFPLNERLELGFRDIEILPDDWDTYGSPAPTKATVDLAKRVCSLFPSQFQPEILPERDGSVGLYFLIDEVEFAIFANANGTGSQGNLPRCYLAWDLFFNYKK